MERITGHKLSAEQGKRSVGLMSLLSLMSWHGSPHLSEFPYQISIKDQLAQIIDELWGAHIDFDVEVASTVLTTFSGNKIKSAEIQKGGHGAVEAKKLIPPAWGRFYRPRINIHTHPEPYPFSIGDLLHLLRKKGGYNLLGYFPAMMVVNEGEIWAAVRSKETPSMGEEEFRRISMGLDHRVTNNENWQNIGLFGFAKEYSIALYYGSSRNSPVLVRRQA